MKVCTNGNSFPQKGKITYYRTNYIFLKKPSTVTTSNWAQTDVSSAKSNTPKKKTCNWSWAVNDVATRMPRYLVYAKCDNTKCNPLRCKKITYTHYVLVRDLDCQTGEKVWKWKGVPLPIFYKVI